MHFADGVWTDAFRPISAPSPGRLYQSRWSDQSDFESGHYKESPHMLKQFVAYGVLISPVALVLYTKMLVIINKLTRKY